MMRRETLQSYLYLAVALLIIIGLIRIFSTYSVFWQTWDEPSHIAAGMQWLDVGKYTYDEMHPPLPRVMCALGPYLDGVRSTGLDYRTYEGNNLLHYNDTYERNLTLARLGVLPFFVIATLVVWIWARLYFGGLTALLSVILFTTLPPVLAHSGLATTDMACAATFIAAIFAFYLWLEKPTFLRSLLVGITVGLASIAKFSNLAFLAVSGCLIAILYYFNKNKAEDDKLSLRLKQWIAASCIAVLACFLVIWAGYRFSSMPLSSLEKKIHVRIDRIVGTEGILHDVSYFVADKIPIPAPEFFLGIKELAQQNAGGNFNYLLGEAYTKGRWYFFPIIISVETPLPFLILAAIGVIVISRHVFFQRRDIKLLTPVIAAVGILAASMMSNLNLGIRHILPIYPLLAIVGGYGAIMLWRFRQSQGVGPALLTILLVWQITSSFAVHPDYIAYYNEIAGRHPENIVLGDTDWGQDLKRLNETLKKRGINEFSICYGGSADLDRLGLPSRKKLIPYQKTTGWIASDLLCSKLGAWGPPYDHFSWLDAYEPVEVVGKTIRLYYISE